MQGYLGKANKLSRGVAGFSGSSYQGQTGPKLAKYFSTPA